MIRAIIAVPIALIIIALFNKADNKPLPPLPPEVSDMMDMPDDWEG